MRPSVYFDSILKEEENNFHREILISTAHMLEGMLPSEKILKNTHFSAS